MAPGNNALVFIDNHDNQRGHGAGGQNIITFREPQLYKVLYVVMITHVSINKLNNWNFHRMRRWQLHSCLPGRTASQELCPATTGTKTGWMDRYITIYHLARLLVCWKRFDGEKSVWKQDKNDWIGPPVDGNMNTLPVVVNPDDTCGNGWICEHRWRQIYNMVKFRNVAGGEIGKLDYASPPYFQITQRGLWCSFFR